MTIKWLNVCVILGVSAFLGLYAYEPKLSCYFCTDCADNYENTGIECDPRFYFCVYLVKPDGVVNRYCGDYGNCTALLEPGGNCSICSAHLCNAAYNTKASDAWTPQPNGVHMIALLGALWVTA